MSQKFIETSSDFLKLFGALLLNDVLSSVFEINFPIEILDDLITLEWILLNLAGFQHKNSSSQVSLGLF